MSRYSIIEEAIQNMKNEVYKYTANYIFDHENICAMLEVLEADFKVAFRISELESEQLESIRADIEKQMNTNPSMEEAKLKAGVPTEGEEDKGFQVYPWIFHPDFELVPFDPDTCPRMPELMSIKTVKHGTGKELAEEQRKKERYDVIEIPTQEEYRRFHPSFPVTKSEGPSEGVRWIPLTKEVKK